MGAEMNGALKKVVFVAHPFLCGGVEKSMLSVMSFLSPTRYDVRLLLLQDPGSMLLEVPKHVKTDIIHMPSEVMYGLRHSLIQTVMHSLLGLKFAYCGNILWMRMKWWMRRKKDNLFEQILGHALTCMVANNKGFDADFAFAYSGGVYVGSVVKYLIKAPVKAIWCHGEGQIGEVASEQMDALYTSFTYRFATYDMAKELNRQISRADKQFEVLPYYLDTKLYFDMAKEGSSFDDDYSGVRILTVGRLAYQKGIDDAIEIASRLKTEGVDFRWYVIGDGEDERKLLGLIREKGVSDRFFLLGRQLNPYGYIQKCDIYAQPSRWEAFCIALAEARAFNRPIICTDFVGAREQVKNGETGLISPVGDIGSFYLTLRGLVENAALRDRLTRALEIESADSVMRAKEAWENLLK